MVLRTPLKLGASDPAGADPAATRGREEVPAPRHVAIIMDGNGRWATRRGLPRVAGHRAGVEAVRRTIRATMEAGVGWLTLYAFSSENWRRPAGEVSDLTGLLRHFLRNEVAELDSNSQDLAIVEAIVNMAHSVGLRTVAEGVEHHGQQAVLGVLGCQEGQGYLFARPLDALAATDWLAARGASTIDEPALIDCV